MHEAIEDSIGKRRVTDGLVPVLDGKLAGDERGAHIVAVLEKFEEITSALLSKGGCSKVIEHDEVGARKLSEELAVAAIAFGDGKLLQPAWGARIEHAEALAAGLLGQRAGNPGLPDTGGPRDQDIAVLAQPL